MCTITNSLKQSPKKPSLQSSIVVNRGIRARLRYATEAAAALVAFAFTHNTVRRVWAHTLPEANASTRVLTKCGFAHTGEVIDPDDGFVWRWEIKEISNNVD